MYNRYLAQLKRDCTNVWTNGRQLCESLSLTGHNCILEYHRLPTSEPPTTLDDLTLNEPESSSADKSEDDTTPMRNSRLQTELDKNKRSRSNRTVSGGSRVTDLKVKHHVSNIVTRAASNCGEFQRERKDPFDLIEANFKFYQDFNQPEMISRKAAQFEYILPVFKPSVLNAKPSGLFIHKIFKKIYITCFHSI